MRKILVTLLLVISIASCNKSQEIENASSTKHEYVDWELDTATYDAVQADEVQEEYTQGNIEWIWDGSQYDTIHTGTTLRITNIDGDKVYITLSK